MAIQSLGWIAGWRDWDWIDVRPSIDASIDGLGFEPLYILVDPFYRNLRLCKWRALSLESLSRESIAFSRTATIRMAGDILDSFVRGGLDRYHDREWRAVFGMGISPVDGFVDRAFSG